MFNNLRRPVPSKAALKVLYQLAYISSGTAVGIATLCTEERRRQAKIVQKIADNAKRIRQSPRYVHNAATAARRDESGDSQHELMQYAPLDQMEGEQGEYVQGEHVNGWKRRPVRDSDLPSAVERGYEQLSWRGYKRARKRRRSARDQAKTERVRNPFVSDQSTNHGVLRRVEAPTALINVYSRGRHGGSRLSFVQQVEEAMENDMPSHFRDMLKNSPKESFRGRRKSVTPQSLSLDIDLFFQKQPWSSNGITETMMASVLFLDAIKFGTLVEIDSLFRWMATRDALQPAHFIAICDAHRGLADRLDHQELFEFYRKLFETDEFRGLETTERIHSCLTVAEDSGSWDLDLTVVSRYNRLLKCVKASEFKEILDVLDGAIDKLLDSHNAPRAHRWTNMVVLKMFRSSRIIQMLAHDETQRLGAIRSKVFESALMHGQFATASRHLEHALRYEPDDALFRLERFALACAQRDSFAELSRFLHPGDVRCKIDHLVLQLSDMARAAVARACIGDRKRPLQRSLFDELYSTLPEEHRQPLFEARTSRQLQDQWSSNHDLSVVWEEYRSARDFALHNGTQELKFALDTAMIDICNAANRPDQALRLLSDLHQRTPHSSRTLSMAAVSLAQKNAWERVRKLVDLMATSGTFVQDGPVSRCFENIIRRFAHRHNPADTWKFVTGLIEKLRFVPTWATTQIVLRAFVRKKHLSFVSHWIRYLKTMGHRFEMDVRAAASLMNAYYLDQRPPHVLIMWFCRKITQLVPSFDAAEFERVMLEANTYDLRKGKGELLQKAEKNLNVLQHLEGVISRPFNERPFASPDGPFPKVPDSSGATRLVPQTNQVGNVPSRQASQGNLPLEAPTVDELFQNLMRDFETENAPSDHPTASYSDMKSDGHVTETIGSSPTQNPDDEMFEQESELSQYLMDLEADLQTGRPCEGPAQRIQREMLTKFSLQHYEEVLEIFRSSRSPAGLPISRQALETAVEASLRLRRGDRAEAQDIIAEARRAGMDTSSAVQPILLHHMWHLNADDKKDVNNLRLMVMDWDRANEANGLPMNNHIGVTAANILINNHRPEYGINLLSDLSRSERIQKEPFDIVAMTVFIKGYAALRSEKGIKWTVETVLKNDMRIDRKFLDTLKVCATHFEASGASRTGKPNMRPNHFRAQLRQWRLICSQRRTQQRQSAKVFGRNLVKFISKLANESRKPVINADVRKELDAQLFGASPFHEAATSAVSPEKRRRLRRTRMRVAREIRWDQGPRHEGLRTADVTRDAVWVQQYRAFLRRDVVMPDGKLASFRYRLANVPRRKRAREARSGQPAPINESVVHDFDEEESSL
ncbi:hypothetical protein M409DRAFT_56488 [Zasmidium cellare ATCC 36951]|uniref:Uncharacterized protein n=1 Tax=Zasmidium cellare ATCC 36951 TaxID=1080233 RepID=A0A6A6CC94_ZASCE|nr:uncharacterized protein M409DRAFT_56488 [Zasmidium cellare ATCC 36951]KAF2164675.1 hypothetical protein M409DRAFT_56488 [Zasmidium cellare ATCC 36951]